TTRTSDAAPRQQASTMASGCKKRSAIVDKVRCAQCGLEIERIALDGPLRCPACEAVFASGARLRQKTVAPPAIPASAYQTAIAALDLPPPARDELEEPNEAELEQPEPLRQGKATAARVAILVCLGIHLFAGICWFRLAGEVDGLPRERGVFHEERFRGWALA